MGRENGANTNKTRTRLEVRPRDHEERIEAVLVEGLKELEGLESLMSLESLESLVSMESL